MDSVVSLIFEYDQKWEWDDANNSDLPIATTSLVASQSDYSIPVTHLKILKLRIKDANGNWISIDPVDRNVLSDAELNALPSTPRKYDKVGNSIFLYPAPNYAYSGGLEVQFQRGGSYFVASDTTKVPGFASIFHRLISLPAARDYCVINNPTRLVSINNEITRVEAKIASFFADRNKDEKQFFSLAREDYGQRALGNNSRNPYRFDI